MASKCKLITAQALADILELSVETIWRYTRSNTIPYVTLGSRQYRYDVDQVMAALANKTREGTSKYSTQQTYTYQDYLKLPETPGLRHEVLAGQLIADPAPNVQHQRVSFRLGHLLATYFAQADPTGEVFVAPLDVTLGETTVVQPDLFFISGKQKQIIKKTRIDGAPTLVIEIISESSRRKDRLTKLQIYQQAGVGHYWLVDPDDRTFECYALGQGRYSLVTSGMDDDDVTHPNFTDLTISLEELWKQN